MLYDLGNYGLQILLGFSVGFGAIAQVLAGRSAPRWLWLAGALGWFVGGLVMSEVVVGRMTSDEIQPIIDGLAFDEALLGGLLGGLLGVAAAWLTRHPVGASRAAPTWGSHRAKLELEEDRSRITRWRPLW